MTTDDTPAIRRAEVDNSERPAIPEYAEPVEPEIRRAIFIMADDIAKMRLRIAELERERDDHARDLGEAIGLLRAVVAIQPHDMRETMCYIQAFLAAHPAPTPTTAAEPQNLEQE
jgi:hypothetical protein